MEPGSSMSSSTTSIGLNASTLVQPTCEPGNELVCSICYDPPSRPVSTFCGHLFCRACLHSCRHSGLEMPCPVCRLVLVKGKSTSFPVLGNNDKSMKRDMKMEIGAAGTGPIDDSSTVSLDQSAATARAKKNALKCHICGKLPTDAVVVVRCGHLFCWPCLYGRLHKVPKSAWHCPVCGVSKLAWLCGLCRPRAGIELDINPIYGCGHESAPGPAPVPECGNEHQDHQQAALSDSGSGMSISQNIPPRPRINI